MPIVINLTDEQTSAVEQFFSGRESLPEAEALEFIQSNSLPWETADAFRMWAKSHGYFKSDGIARTTKTSAPSVKGINKFSGETDAMATAKLLLEDKDKAIAGAISQLEKEVENIQLEAEQQMSIIKSAAEEKIAERKEKIKELRDILPTR